MGRYSTILQSDPVAPAGPVLQLIQPAKAGSGFTFEFTGQMRQNYQVQVSGDLAEWFPSMNVACTSTPMPCEDKTVTDALRFYRVVKP